MLTFSQFKRRVSQLLNQGAVVGCLAAFFSLLLLYSRRGQTIINPQVWNEDGVFIVPEFIKHGWMSMALPVNGYLISIARLISNLSLSVAPDLYPTVSTSLTLLFTAAVAAYIAVAPTLLKGRFFLALSCFLVPVDPEVLGIPLYTFWWAGLVLLTIPLWQRDNRYFKFRLAALILCGLSSPLVVLITPLLAIRAYFLRLRVDYLVFLAAASCTCAQLFFILMGKNNANMPHFSSDTFFQLIEKFFGYFIASTDLNFFGSFLWAGVFLILLLIFSLSVIRDRWTSVVLVYFLVGAIALSIVRAPIEAMHPVVAGPRYFFYPFVLVAWILIQGIDFSFKFTFVNFRSLLLLAALALSIHNIFNAGWSRGHDDIEWSRNIESCTHFDNYLVPLQGNGDRAHFWRASYSREMCNFLAAKQKVETDNLYPFVVKEVSGYFSSKLRHDADSFRSAIIKNELKGSNYDHSAPAGHIPLGTWGTGDGDTGSITLSMQKGAQILYTSGPGGTSQYFNLHSPSISFFGHLPVCLQWCSLEFSFDELPSEFVVTLSDAGASWGEWFAVGIPFN